MFVPVIAGEPPSLRGGGNIVADDDAIQGDDLLRLDCFGLRPRNDDTHLPL
ncbi:MAG: hypothetical protein LBT00_03360 [Spirochaetaceae bacterium]|nr:hypothetical protein [Spirochaetaceae bacterium]